MFARNTIRIGMLSAALCTAVASVSLAQMDDAKPVASAAAHSAIDKMGADAQIAAALMKIKADPKTAGDKLFVLDNACGNMFESAFSKLVASKVTDQKLKDLATMIDKDHTMANDKLKPIAKKLGLDLPTGLPSEKQGKLDVMAGLPAEELGKMYLMMQRSIHAKDVTTFADHEKAVKDDELKAYISETLPKLKEHGAHINMVADDMGAAAKDTPADSLKGKM